ncbi:MAG: hypothetical protein AB8E15_04375 [Bdellovibrionales bacterium]
MRRLKSFIPNILVLAISMMVVLFANLPLAQAKNFRNAYVSFDLPSNWQCHLEDTEWICRSQNKKASREAIIILTAKEVGATDSLDAYSRFLAQTKAVSGANGQPINSQVKHVKQNKVSNHVWIDGLHLSSEVANYYTRYLATTKGRIAVLVTFSAHQRFYANYAHQFFKAIQSLRVVATDALFSQPNLAPLGGANEQLGQGLVNAFPSDMLTDEDFDDEYYYEEEDGEDNTTLYGIIILILALGGYLFVKSRS